MQLATTAAAPISRPNVVPRDATGTVTGSWTTRSAGERIGTEFGRGHMGRAIELVSTGASELYYQAPDHAVRAAALLSSGTFLGAISLNSANFVGVELRSIGTTGLMGTGGSPAPYEFESLAQTRAGRDQLERTLKLGLGDWAVVDGDWAAVRQDEAGNVRVIATKDYVRELQGGRSDA